MPNIRYVHRVLISYADSDVEGLVIKGNKRGRYDIMWNDGLLHEDIHKDIILRAKYSRHLTNKEALLWKLKNHK